ncbi:hypothetical protein FB451DRAFT_1402838 [Mycena latifolia]|nr:hypothetical protein FB451DRAFT_1402838 [Mycena latifolia]
MPTAPISPSPSPSSPANPSKPPSRTIPIVISVVAVLLLASLMLLTFHFRRQNKKKISAAQARKGREIQAGETVSRTHPAALMITPAEGKGTPRFVHTPGTNMRIASRRSDGAWEFADPRAPFTPAIIADAADAALPASRTSSATNSVINERSSHPRDPSPSRARSPYSHASCETPGSSTELLPPSTAATPWGPPTPTPETAESLRSPWRAVHSPTPSTSASTFLPARSISGSSRRGSVVSSNDSFLDLERSEAASIYSNPFLSPTPSAAPSRNARWPARSPPASARASPEPRTRVTRDIRRGYEEADTSSAHAEQSEPSRATPAPARAAPVSPEPPMTPAALAKQMESRAAREIRRGYESVDRHSEYAEQDEGLPAY